MFERTLTHPRLGFEILREDCKSAPKVQFYCLRSPLAAAGFQGGSATEAGAPWSPPKKAKRKQGSKGGGAKWAFSVVLPEGAT